MHLDSETGRDHARRGVIRQEPIGVEMFREGNGLRLAEVQEVSCQPVARRSARRVVKNSRHEPARSDLGPVGNQLVKLLVHRRRHNGLADEPEKIKSASLVEMKDRSGIGDDPPQPPLPF